MKQTLVITGFLLLLLGGLAACTKNSNGSSVNSNYNGVITGGPKRYLALGDSYTIGESVTEAERYPNQLKDSMGKQGIFVETVSIVAKTGWKTSDLLKALNTNPPGGYYDLVTILIGVNNQYGGGTTATYTDELKLLFDKCLQYANGDKKKVVVISIPDYSVVPYSRYSDTVKIRTQLEQFNNINRNMAIQYDFKYVDVFRLSQEARNDLSLVASDGLHFSGKEYAKWTSRLVPFAKEILR